MSEKEGRKEDRKVGRSFTTGPIVPLTPQEARKHALRARKEGLLAMKSLIDSTLEKLEEREEKTGKIREIKNQHGCCFFHYTTSGAV